MNTAQALVALATLLAMAVVSDLRSRRIPNALIATGMLLACALHAAALSSGQPPLAGAPWWAPLAGALLGAAALLPMYLLRAAGAGDVKLLAMVGAFVGAATVLAAALYTLIAGGLLALLFLAGRGVARRTLANLRALAARRPFEPSRDTAAGLPYAAAIAAGTTAALLWPLQALI
jgi:prepilin peptidase CpaA